MTIKVRTRLKHSNQNGLALIEWILGYSESEIGKINPNYVIALHRMHIIANIEMTHNSMLDLCVVLLPALRYYGVGDREAS